MVLHQGHVTDRQTDRQTDGQITALLMHNKYVGHTSLQRTIFTRPVCHINPTTRIARRCTAYGFARTLLLQRALPLGQTDGRTDRRTRHRFNTRSA